MFSAELVALDDDRRRAPRLPVRLPGRVTAPTRWRALCRIVDVSRHGARAETYEPLEEGATIFLSLPGVPALRGRVAWAGPLGAAIAFDVPLDDATLADLVVRFGEPCDTDRPVGMMVPGIHGHA